MAKYHKSRYVWFNYFSMFINFTAKLRLRLKGIKPGTILIGPNLTIKVLAVGAGQLAYLEPIPAMAIEVLRDTSPGEHLTGSIMNTYTTLDINVRSAVISITDLHLFNLRVANKVERLIYGDT